MALSPEEIERREFALVSMGYDADEVRKFLFEVAATVRMSRHDTHPPSGDALASRVRSLSAEIPDDLRLDAARWPARGHESTTPDAVSFFVPPAIPAARDTTAPRPLDGPAGARLIDAPASSSVSDGDPFDQVGSEVAELLRAAHDSVKAIIEKAEDDAAGIRDDAEHDAREIRRRAEADAVWQQDRAKRVLTTVQDQADGILAEAEAQGRAIVAGATEQADLHAKQVTEKAQRHVEDILRAEREALARLHSAQHDVGRAIETIVRADNRPVLDVRAANADLRLGTGDADPESDTGTAPGEGWTAVQELAQQDPLMQMVRQAVDRAVDAAAADPALASGLAGDHDGRGPRDAHPDGANPDGAHAVGGATARSAAGSPARRGTGPAPVDINH